MTETGRFLPKPMRAYLGNMGELLGDLDDADDKGGDYVSGWLGAFYTDIMENSG